MKSVTAKLTNIRATIDTLRSERKTVGAQRLSRTEAVRNIEIFVEAQGAMSGLDLATFATAERMPRSWPAVVGAPGTVDPLPAANVAPALALLMPEMVIKRLVKLLDDRIGDSYGPTHAEKKNNIARITGEILKFEIQEEDAVRQLEIAETFVVRRSDIENPVVIALKDLSQ